MRKHNIEWWFFTASRGHTPDWASFFVFCRFSWVSCLEHVGHLGILTFIAYVVYNLSLLTRAKWVNLFEIVAVGVLGTFSISLWFVVVRPRLTHTSNRNLSLEEILNSIFPIRFHLTYSTPFFPHYLISFRSLLSSRTSDRPFLYYNRNQKFTHNFTHPHPSPVENDWNIFSQSLLLNSTHRFTHHHILNKNVSLSLMFRLIGRRQGRMIEFA